MDTKFNGTLYHVPHIKRINQGSFRDVFFIYQRVLATVDNDTLEPAENFEPIFTVMGKLETVKSVARIDGVNIIISDQITHSALINYDPAIYQLDRESCWITTEYNQFPSDINRRFDLISAENYNGESRFLVLFLKETGFTDILSPEE